MALFTTNKQAQAFLRKKKFFIATDLFLLLLWASYTVLIYSTGDKQPGNRLVFLDFPWIALIVVLAFFGKAYYDIVYMPIMCNHFIQSIEYDGGHINIKTFPFKTIIPPRNLKPIEFTIEENKLVIRRSGRWSRFSEREVFIIVHEGEKYCLAPYYFDDFDSMIHILPFVKVEAMA